MSELHKDYNDIAFKVGHDLFPNFRLAVAAIDGRDLRATSKEFTVERELKVVVKPLKEAFLPGEDGKIEITVTDQTGQPVAAELSLALVNEALFAVCPDATTPILDFFQKDARRHADFHTGATCGFRYAGTTRPVAKALTDENGRLARDKDEKKALEAVREELSRSVANAPAPAARPQARGDVARRWRAVIVCALASDSDRMRRSPDVGQLAKKNSRERR